MPIITNNVITWNEMNATCLEAIVNMCCNIGTSFPSSIPQKMRAGTGREIVKSIQTQAYTYNFYANPTSGLISMVPRSTVDNEWNTFLRLAFSDDPSDPTLSNYRANKTMTARELGLTIGLYMQFMSYHVKLVNTKRKIYNTIQQQSEFFGCKYVTGSITPKYTLNTSENAPIPELSSSDVTNILSQNFTPSQLMYSYNNFVPYKCGLE